MCRAAECSTQAERDIEEAHSAAEQAGSACYQDPATGYSVFTATFLRDKQVCLPHTTVDVQLWNRYSLVSSKTCMHQLDMPAHGNSSKSVWAWQTLWSHDIGKTFSSLMCLHHAADRALSMLADDAMAQMLSFVQMLQAAQIPGPGLGMFSAHPAACSTWLCLQRCQLTGRFGGARC